MTRPPTRTPPTVEGTRPLRDGVLLVDKPAGPTSHDVVGRARRILGTPRVGHAGTLDPPATGLLVLLVGRATRLMRFVSLLPKAYTGTVRFGWETTTDDAAGTPTLTDDAWAGCSEQEMRAALERVRLQPTQVPPPVSAKKVDGERAYRKARRGETVELEAVPVSITRLSPLAFRLPPEVDLEVECSAGTYVRSIARDLGRALGTRAHLSALRRTAIGPWSVADATPLDALDQGAGHELLPMADAVRHLPRVDLGDDDARRFGFGQKLAGHEGAGYAAVFAHDALLGVAERKDGVLHPAVGLA